VPERLFARANQDIQSSAARRQEHVRCLKGSPATRSAVHVRLIARPHIDTVPRIHWRHVQRIDSRARDYKSDVEVHAYAAHLPIHLRSRDGRDFSVADGTGQDPG